MKIRFLIANAYGVGGTIKATYNLSAALAERGHDVEIVSVQKHLEDPAFEVSPLVRLRALYDRSPRVRRKEKKRKGVASRTKGTIKEWALERRSRVINRGDARYDRFNLFTDLRLLQFLRSVDDGILIGTRPGLNIAIAQYARPSVVRIGQDHLNMTKYGPTLRAGFRRWFPRLDAYATLTERDAEAFRELLGPAARVVTLPNGVPEVHGARSSNDSKIAIAAGRLTSQKGFDQLVSAWAEVATRHPDWSLRIFGRGALRKELTEQIESLGLGDSVRLMGFTDKLPQELAAASFYVMSSRFEGFPMVLLEAMQCGLPVVSFDCPNGPRDLITVGEDGLLVPDGDVDGLARAIIEMIELGERRSELGRAAFEKAKQYEISAVAARWEELFEELLEQRSRGARSRNGARRERSGAALANRREAP